MRNVALALTLFSGSALLGQISPASALQETGALIDSVRSTSFPQFKDARIAVRPMHSDSVYLQSRFTFSSFFFGRHLRYVIRFNPEASVRGVPPDGLRAIVAHELAHVDYYRQGSRLRLLSLMRLLSGSFEARFERGADLDAIILGYGPGLEVYRTWLYSNIPARRIATKKRNYFSPVEIEALLRAARENPQRLKSFVGCVPRNLAEIEQRSESPVAPCSH